VQRATSLITATLATAGTLAATLTGPPTGGRVAAAELAGSDRPNIVFIVMDDLRRDDLPWLPTIEQEIGSTGTAFSSFYASTALCCPSRASMLRGQYPHNTGVLTNAEPDGGFTAFHDLETSTLATWLDPTYATGYVGKYLNGYEGATQTHVPPGWDDWNATTRTYHYLRVLSNDNGTVVDNSGVNSPRLFGQQSVEFVRESAPATEPFFLHLSFVTPHGGYPERDYPRLDGERRASTAFVPVADRGTYVGPVHAEHDSYNEADTSDKTGPVVDLPPLSATAESRIARQNRQRRESLASADRAIARVIGELRAAGEYADTVVIFTSDNGVMLGEHRIPSNKRQPYQEATNLPFLVTGPGVPAAEVWGGVAGTHDIAPTILDIAGAEAGIEMDGMSVLSHEWRRDTGRAVVLEQPALPIDAENGGAIRYAAPRSVKDTEWAYRGLVTKRWKFVSWDRLGTEELYDLRADPNELSNLSEQREWQHKSTLLRRRLAQLWMCSGQQCNR